MQETERRCCVKDKWSIPIAAGLTALLLTGAVGLYLERPRTPLEITVQHETVSVTVTASAQTTVRAKESAAAAQHVAATTQTVPAETAPPEHNLNLASADDLMRVSGIGETLAAEIIAARTSLGGFTSRTQLCEISGIGEALMQRIMAEFEIPDEVILQDSENIAEPEPVYYINVYEANTVTREELLTLPDMTETKADAILSLRNQLGQFRGIYELSLAEGISGEYFEHVLIHHLYIEGDPDSVAQNHDT